MVNASWWEWAAVVGLALAFNVFLAWVGRRLEKARQRRRLIAQFYEGHVREPDETDEAFRARLKALHAPGTRAAIRAAVIAAGARSCDVHDGVDVRLGHATPGVIAVLPGVPISAEAKGNVITLRLKLDEPATITLPPAPAGQVITVKTDDAWTHPVAVTVPDVRTFKTLAEVEEAFGMRLGPEQAPRPPAVPIREEYPPPRLDELVTAHIDTGVLAKGDGPPLALAEQQLVAGPFGTEPPRRWWWRADCPRCGGWGILSRLLRSMGPGGRWRPPTRYTGAECFRCGARGSPWAPRWWWRALAGLAAVAWFWVRRALVDDEAACLRAQLVEAEEMVRQLSDHSEMYREAWAALGTPDCGDLKWRAVLDAIEGLRDRKPLVVIPRTALEEARNLALEEAALHLEACAAEELNPIVRCELRTRVERLRAMQRPEAALATSPLDDYAPSYFELAVMFRDTWTEAAALKLGTAAAASLAGEQLAALKMRALEAEATLEDSAREGVAQMMRALAAEERASLMTERLATALGTWKVELGATVRPDAGQAGDLASATRALVAAYDQRGTELDKVANELTRAREQIAELEEQAKREVRLQ